MPFGWVRRTTGIYQENSRFRPIGRLPFLPSHRALKSCTKQPEWAWAKMGWVGQVWTKKKYLPVFAHFCPCPFVCILAVIPLNIFKTGRMGMGINGAAHLWCSYVTILLIIFHLNITIFSPLNSPQKVKTWGSKLGG